MEIDTTELFNSPLRQQTVINSEGGVLQWTPPLPLTEQTVYYWRSSPLPSDGTSYNWQNSSFIYLESSPTGWNQSHYYQFQKDKYTHLLLDSLSRHFEFEGVQHFVSAVNAWNTGLIVVSFRRGYPIGIE